MSKPASTFCPNGHNKDIVGRCSSGHCKMCQKEDAKLYYANNKDKIKQDKINWNRKNRQKINDYVLKRRTEEDEYRIQHCLRSRLNRAIKGNYKVGSAVNDLGCSIDFLKQYLEVKFLPNMSWDNHGIGAGKWHIDHIVPLDSFDLTDRDQLLKAVHYTNLQPLWEPDNIKKGSKILNFKENYNG